MLENADRIAYPRLADDCEVAAGISLDCNANGIPDGCDTECVADCDSDGDLCLDDVDSDPFDWQACADVDGDSCDDCSAGSFDPQVDGPDTDGDGFCDAGDCHPGDAWAWSEPGSIDTLTVSEQGGLATLTWYPPAEPGGVPLRYDALQSDSGSDFIESATCVESDDWNRNADVPETPRASAVHYYLIRVENPCPGGSGNMGSDSEGVPRVGLPCP